MVSRDLNGYGIWQAWSGRTRGEDGDNDLTTSLVGNDKVSTVYVECDSPY